MRENFATVLETVADVRADCTAVTHGERSLTWRQLDERASRLATFLAGRGVGAETRVAIALYNGIEYLESVFAVLKLRAIPVNVNYRYQYREMLHVLDDAQVDAVIFDASLGARVAEARARARTLHTLVQVGGAPAAPVSSYEQVIGVTGPLPRAARGVDHWLMYTGGTTGKPKGVLARHSWLYPVVCANGFRLIGEPVPDSLDALQATTRRLSARGDGDAMVCLPAPPLMHATGMYTTLGALLASGRVVYLTGRSYDPDELARTIAGQRADTVSIVGDVFALPLADALDRAAQAGRPYDLSSLKRIVSVGVTWSAHVKRRLLEHGDFVCRDLVAASEGGPFAVSETRRGDDVMTGRFTLMPGARIIDETGGDVVAGSGQVGMLAALADDEIGYLGDDAKTAQTFRRIDGRRWVVTGDLASREADGSITFRGRASRVINTGGEKVFAEEVEQVLIEHPGVRDALVVGLPDQRWGQRVTAVVARVSDEGPAADALIAHVAERLADYKKPRGIVFVTDLQRSPSGKADLQWAQAVAAVGQKPDEPTSEGGQMSESP
ncbi:MAG TPA: AMP-binding protein [Streptosporangiaceae bacterium]|nr:AMP-binding protein [Streptosporangiaceae bacterium]